MRRSLLKSGAVAAVLLAAAGTASAHEGPPFPIVMDRTVGPYTISVWTDPDVGVGKFFVILEAAPGKTLSGNHTVSVCVQPTDDRLPEACYAAVRQDIRGREQYYGEVQFDRQETWKVRVCVTGSDGDGEVAAEVEATPPGFGAWDLLLYGFPFILFGALWAYAALRRRAAGDTLQSVKPKPP
jgi:hypothetical protein